MKIQIKNKNQDVLFETDNVGKAYSFLKGIVPEKHICAFIDIKSEVARDQELEVDDQRYQFMLNDEDTDCVYMDVEYA